MAQTNTDVAAGLVAIDESFAVLAGTEWPERRAGDREDHLATMWALGSSPGSQARRRDPGMSASM